MLSDSAAPCVTVIDDDESVVVSLGRLLASCGLRAEGYTSPAQFLARTDHAAPGCVVVDLSMPALDGRELQRRLAEANDARPLIFISGRADVENAVGALKAGAADFITKPLDAERFLAAVSSALARDAAARQLRQARSQWQEHFDTLTGRERQVLGGVVEGKLNKQIAADLGTSEKTIKVHRSRLMHKMFARTHVQLIRDWLAFR